MAAVPEEDHVLIRGVDQPRPAAVVTHTVEAHLATGASITVAGHGGRRGHPVVFAPWLRDELRGIDEATQGLRAVLQRHDAEVQVAESGSPLALVNLNTPADYSTARRLLEPMPAPPL
jgi:molybdenum cofactor cytidylyltransferase